MATPTTIRGLPRPLARALEGYADRLDVDLIRDAYDLASKAHAGQQRASGEEYVSHVVDVATILAQFRLDTASIVGALVHDIVEDTEVTLSDINKQFGPFDAVFLPINGARVAQDPMPVSTLVQTPSQAVDVALLLRAKVLVPIHYGLNDPPNYVEVDEPLATLLTEAEQRGQVVQHLLPGEELVWIE